MDSFLAEYEDHWLNQIPRCTTQSSNNMAACNDQFDATVGPYMVTIPNPDTTNRCGPNNPDTAFCTPDEIDFVLTYTGTARRHTMHQTSKSHPVI